MLIQSWAPGGRGRNGEGEATLQGTFQSDADAWSQISSQALEFGFVLQPGGGQSVQLLLVWKPNLPFPQMQEGRNSSAQVRAGPMRCSHWQLSDTRFGGSPAGGM